jgi:uncharacterized protein (TIGR01777 family)
MKIAITGATGFLGRALLAHLSTLGHDCLGLTRDPARARVSDPTGTIEYRHLDDLPAVDAVIHLAGENPAGLWTPWKRRAIFESRVIGTRTLVSALRHRPPAVLLSASAIGIYGDRPGETLDESAVPDPQRRFRARVCLAWEHEAAAAWELGTRVVHLRIGNVMDPSGGYLGHMRPLHRVGAGFVFGNAEASVPWISLLDAVRLIAFALENETLRGPLNVVSPHPVTQRALATGLAQRVGQPIRGRLPAPLLRCVLGELASALVDDQFVIPAKATAAGFRFAHPAWRGAVDAIFEETEASATTSPLSTHRTQERFT